MIPLARSHPAMRSLGAATVLAGKLVGAAFAVFGIIARDAKDHALETVELVQEIATDAENLSAEVDAIVADGIVTPEETRRLKALVLEIRDEATTGRIA